VSASHHLAHAREHFQQLGHREQRSAVCGLIDDGIGEHEVARITGLAVEQVRRFICARTSDPP
jgi:hypothetical protein